MSKKALLDNLNLWTYQRSAVIFPVIILVIHIKANKRLYAIL